MPKKTTYEELVHKVQVLEKELLEQKEIGKALRNAILFSESLIKIAQAIVLVLDKGANIVGFNPYMEEISGFPLEELRGKDWFTAFLPEHKREQARKMFLKDISGIKTQGRINPIITKKGKTIEIEWHDAPLKDEQGDIIGMLSIGQDVTERINLTRELEMRTEASLRANERFLGAVLDSIQDGISVLDPELNIICVNQTMRKWYAHELPLEGKKCYEAYHGRSEVCEICPTIRALKTGRLEMNEVPFMQENKMVGTQELFAFPMLDDQDKPTGVVEYVRDISDKKEIEAQLRQAQKLEVIGTLAGGLAHDFNNLLGGIMGYIELSQNTIQPESEVYENLSKALEACFSAKELTNQFITFSKGGRPLRKTGSIVKLIRDTSNLVLAGSSVKCEFCIPEDLWLVDFDEIQIKQVFNNLIINAREAMLDRGTISVTAENVSVEDDIALAMTAGKYVKISIEDHGFGIPKENIEKIFDPYFTTKQMGAKKGMGLGLATVYSIVKKHDGAIKVESDVGGGTTSSIYLPASEKEFVEEKPKKEKPLPLKKGTALVMDDEPMLRNIATMMLTKMGYKVEEAKDGAEAIEMYKNSKQSGRPFDVVILDLTVKGGMGGMEAIEKLLEIDPEVKAIVSSGYSSDEIMTDYKRYGFRFAVPKPYSLAELRAALSEAMVEEIKDH